MQRGRIEEVDLYIGQIYNVQSQLGCLLLCRRTAELLDSGGSRRLKYKVKVLLRSQSNFIPPLLVNGRLAYGDTKGRSISIANGAVPGRKPGELALICVINQLIVTGKLTRVTVNVSYCDNINICLLKQCYNKTHARTPTHRIIFMCTIMSRPDRKNNNHVDVIFMCIYSISINDVL